MHREVARPQRDRFDETGSAAIEFIGVGVILLVPLLYLVLALGTVHAQVLGVESAARHTARAMNAPGGAQGYAEVVLASIVEEYGIDPSTLSVQTTCSPSASPCPSPGSIVMVTVRAEVVLPFAPGGLGRIPIEASAVQKISRTGTGG